MKFHFSTTRRQLSKKILVLFSSGSVLSACDFFTKTTTDEVIKTLTGLLRHDQMAIKLGQIYLKTNPQLQLLDAIQLANRILQKVDLSLETISATELTSMTESLKRRIHDDFSNDSVVTIEGWLLSQTETELCALYFLSSNA